MNHNQLIIIKQMNRSFGKYISNQAIWKHNPKNPLHPYLNNINRRNRQLVERTPTRMPSSSLASASIKSIRLYRHICRMIPYILKVHEILHRTTPEQAKIYVANHFRANAHLTDLAEIDRQVDIGYEMLHEAEWHFAQTGYLYKYFMSPKGIMNDFGMDRFDEYRAEKANRKSPASSFLKGFYKGHKSYEI